MNKKVSVFIGEWWVEYEDKIVGIWPGNRIYSEVEEVEGVEMLIVCGPRNLVYLSPVFSVSTPEF